MKLKLFKKRMVKPTPSQLAKSLDDTNKVLLERQQALLKKIA